MSRGDLILTPSGLWHDHGNEGSEPVIWVDVLNVPLVESLDATIFEFDFDPGEAGLPTDRQPVSYPVDHSTNLYARGGLKPLFVDHRRGATEHSPQFVYRWRDTRAALESLRGYDGCAHDGILLEYVDPTTGGSVMPSMAFRAQLLRAGEQTQPQRRMASTIYCVLEGRGATEIAGERFEWGPNDVFVIPNWTWSRHLCGDADAVLYSVTDEPVMRKLDLYRHEGRGEGSSTNAG
jgi:gentisate 1,2-dioxygenase